MVRLRAAARRSRDGRGAETQFFIQGFQWAFDTDYFVEIATDASTDGYSVSIDGNEVASDTLSVDLLSYDRLTFSSAFATLGAFETDDVRVSPLPEPGPASAAVVALATLGVWARRRRSAPRRPRSIV